LKRYTRYFIDFDSKYTSACSALMGLSFFLKLAYYFALVSFRDVQVLELIGSMIIGIVISGGMVVCLKCVHYNAPKMYGLVGVLECVILLLLSFTGGNTLRIVLSLLWYVPTAVILLMTINGYLPGRLLSAVMFWIAAVVRFFLFDLGKLSLIRWFGELAVIAMLVAFGCLVMGLKDYRKDKR